jgi:glutaredoxin
MTWTIVTQQNCEWCEKAKQLLVDHDQKFTIIPVDDQGGTQMRRFLKSMNLTTLPQIWDDYGVYIGGYKELKHDFYGGFE